MVKVKDPQASPCLLLDSIYKLMLFCGSTLLLTGSGTVDQVPVLRLQAPLGHASLLPWLGRPFR